MNMKSQNINSECKYEITEHIITNHVINPFIIPLVNNMLIHANYCP